MISAPQVTGAHTLALTVGTDNGAPLTSNRMTGIEVLSGTDLVENFSQWVKLTNGLALTNGRVRIDNVDSGGRPRRYFIVKEPE